MLRHSAGDRMEVFSAGSHPSGFIHDLATQALNRLNIPYAGQRSKSWNEFSTTRFDVVITLCDAAAGEACPVWPGDPIRAHWPLSDPAFSSGTDEERIQFALSIARRLQTKIDGLLALDWSLDRAELSAKIRFLGEI